MKRWLIEIVLAILAVALVCSLAVGLEGASSMILGP